MIIGFGGKEVLGMAPPSERRIAAGDLVTTELTPASTAITCRSAARWWSARRATRSGAPSRLPRSAGGGHRGGAPRRHRRRRRARRERRVPRIRSRRIRHQQVHARARPRPRPVLRFQAAILEDVDTPLTPGMALIVHPNTYHPEVGYMVLGDAVVVTEHGAEVLVRHAARAVRGARENCMREGTAERPTRARAPCPHGSAPCHPRRHADRMT